MCSSQLLVAISNNDSIEFFNYSLKKETEKNAGQADG